MHVRIEDLINIAEGTRPESASPHLAGCEHCRVQLSDLRGTLAAARGVEIPDPSPLFWDHLSARVSEAVAADPTPGPRSFVAELMGTRWIQAAAGIAAALAIGLVLGSGPAVPVALAPSLSIDVADAAPPVDLLRDIAPDDDVSLALVATLTDAVDLDTVREAGLATRGSAEAAVTHMSDGELRELRRILAEELARPGA